jgi:hypothetical protein
LVSYLESYVCIVVTGSCQYTKGVIKDMMRGRIGSRWVGLYVF